MQDINGKSYVLLKDLTKGCRVQVDDGFDCVPPHSYHTIWKDDIGFYFNCEHGQHYVDGHLDDEEEFLIGVYPA